MMKLSEVLGLEYQELQGDESERCNIQGYNRCLSDIDGKVIDIEELAILLFHNSGSYKRWSGLQPIYKEFYIDDAKYIIENLHKAIKESK